MPTWQRFRSTIISSCSHLRTANAPPILTPPFARRKAFSKKSRSFQALSFIVADSITMLKVHE
jgi:hypothetical protein